MSANDVSNIDITKLPFSLLEKIPAGLPPAGIQSNLEDPISRGPGSKIVVYVVLPLMAIPLFMRMYVRAKVQRSWGADDIFAIVSALCLGAYCGLLIWLVDGPGGEHIWDIPISRITAGVMKAHLAAQCIYSLSSIFIKSTLLLLYLRIFRPSRRAGILIWAGIAFVLVSHIAVTAAQIRILTPRSGKSWFNTTTDNVQNEATAAAAAQGVISVATDFYVLCIPISLVAGLHLPMKRKVGVCGIFMTGLIACICSLVGTVIRFRLRSTNDMFWDSIPAYRLTVIELGAGIICSCMPVLPVLFKHVGTTSAYRKSVTLLRDIRIRLTASQVKDTADTEDVEKSHRIHLSIPKPTLTGIRTFIGGGSRSDGKSESFATTDSVSEDYHAQLKAVNSM